MQYSLVFKGMWSSARHPLLYPSDASFSPVVVASHSDDFVLWRPGQLASNGVKVVAETGNPMPVRMELQAAQRQGLVADINHAPRPIGSTDMVKLDITVDRNHPYISIVTMLFPSPDWFSGVRDVNLCDDGKWMSQVDLEELMAYDAGTDSGSEFNSANAVTDPAEPIRLIMCGEGVFCGEDEEFLPVASVHIMRAGDQCKGSQMYKVEFTGLWNAGDHPVAYPENAMFSPAVFATHSRAYSFVNSGDLVSAGVQEVAETGSTKTVLSELNAARKNGIVADYITGPTAMIRADNAHELFSVVSMLFPSPDWVVSKTLSLCDARRNRWMSNVEMTLNVVYDAGTDSGTTFLSADDPTTPQQPISTFGCGTGVLCEAGQEVRPLAKISLMAVRDRETRACRGSRTYSVRMRGRWTASRHPEAYPDDAHFSPIVVAAHNKQYSFFQMGEPVTEGVQQVAETGNPSLIQNELFMQRMKGAVADIAVGTGPFDGDETSDTVHITVDPSNPYVSIISMLAPSPDWFVSSTVNMCDEGRWMGFESMSFDMAYDAGTDMGETFTSPDAPNVTPEGVTAIQCGQGVFCEETLNSLGSVELRD